MSIAHRRLRWTGGLLLLSIGLAGCDLITGNAPEASTIVISPSGTTLDAIGATATLSTEVRDQNDRILRDAVVTWSTSDPNVVTISPAGLVTAVRNGTAAITAAAGAATGSVNLSVTQLASMLEKVSGDGQLGPAGELLPEPLVVHALDRLGNPAIGVPVAFQIIEGGGSPTPAQTETDVQGRASTTWTLGALAGEAQAIRSFLSFSVGQGVNFAATAVPGLPAEIVVVSGDGVAAPRLSTLSDPLTVRVEDRLQNPVTGVPVQFAVIAGGGSVQPSSPSTDVGGLATTQWTLGEPLGDQSVSIMVEPLQPTTVSAFATTVPEVLILGGDVQTGIVGERLPDPPSVQVLGPGGAPVSSLDVDFSVSANGGFLESMDGTEVSPNLRVRTDAMGVATVGGWILATTPGNHEVTVEVPGLVPVVLTATAETGPPALLVKVSGDQQSGVVGTLLAAPLVVRVTDTHGNPVAGSAITFGPASGDGSVVPTQATSDSNGNGATEWTLGSSLGSQSVGASIGTVATVTFTATATNQNGVGGLAIELLFIDQPTVPQRQAFDAAVSRWAALIPGKLEPVPVNFAAGACGSNSPAINQVVDDLLVCVSLEPIDGLLGTLGFAQVLSARQSNGLPIVAHLTIDTDDVARLEASGRLVDLILHELGHALGFGTLWAGKGFLQNPSLPINPGADTHFDGLSAITAFDAIGGNAYTGGQKVPVENQEGGTGTRDSHWRLTAFTNELMTGFLTTGANPLSRVTVASLGDLGYSVDEGGADAFQLFLAAPPAVGEEVEMFPLGDDVLRGTIYLLDEQGRVRGVLQ